MKPDDDIVIIKSNEPYYIGVNARIITIDNNEIKLELFTGKRIICNDPTCLQVIQTKEDRDACIFA